MYKRLIILSAIIVAALFTLSALGYHAIYKWSQGLEGSRLGEFASVAEQIRLDIRHKLNNFIKEEQNRDYSDYQYYYVPTNVAQAQQQMALLRSPLAGMFENKFAYGYFQIESDGTIVTPYVQMPLKDNVAETAILNKTRTYIGNIKENLLPVLNKSAGTAKLIQHGPSTTEEKKMKGVVSKEHEATVDGEGVSKHLEAKPQSSMSEKHIKQYEINVLQEGPQEPKVLRQQRSVAASNVSQKIENTRDQAYSRKSSSSSEPQESMKVLHRQYSESKNKDEELKKADQGVSQEEAFTGEETKVADSLTAQHEKEVNERPEAAEIQTVPEQQDTVQIRIEPFVPVIVGRSQQVKSIFAGQVFLLRHVQIEDKHFLQGFKLNEEKLIQETKESAEKFMRKGMSFEISQTEDPKAAFRAVLDFGFGELVLNLFERDPGWISQQIRVLRNWYLSIIVLVLLAIIFALISVWQNMHKQLQLAQKKDDFVSAVSHELRAPLTSIRMYSEMLEKNWVKSEEKVLEYYKSMRQESERLSRLIENVLDFSRIQRGRKKYNFKTGNINECVKNVVEMMRPCASEAGFVIKMELSGINQTSFDVDAVTQILINLIDNAIKYARAANDKTVIIRTVKDEKFIIIEVEDHGPGVAHKQRKKIFEEFYRSEAESTRETSGTGLGLALVRKFAEAHNGFVEVTSAHPCGAIFKVYLPF